MQNFIYDKKSLTPSGFVRSAIFVTKEYFHRRRDPKYTVDFVADDRKIEAKKYLDTLNRDGIVLLPQHFTGQTLSRLQENFEDAVKNKPTPVKDTFREFNALGAGAPILEAALDDFLLQIIGGYFRKPFGIGRGDATRLMPTPPERGESFQWHHDTRGRQIHGMILLNDVTPAGQRMTYLKGSNNLYYDRFRGESHGSRFEKEIAVDGKIQGEVVDLAGPAGTVGLFDSNGLHSGNRNNEERRDCLLFCYVSHPRHFKPVSLNRGDLMQLPPHKRRLVEMNPRLEIID
jgi:hypothetical protein